MVRQLLAVLMLLSVAAPALAVYRCEDASSPSYSDTPCPGAQPMKLEKASPDPGAGKRLEQEKKELRQLQRKRHQRQARADKEEQRAERAAAVIQRKCTRLARELRWAEEDAAAAAGKRAARARTKAQRAAEQYDESCRHRAGMQIGTGN